MTSVVFPLQYISMMTSLYLVGQDTYSKDVAVNG